MEEKKTIQFTSCQNAGLVIQRQGLLYHCYTAAVWIYTEIYFIEVIAGDIFTSIHVSRALYQTYTHYLIMMASSSGTIFDFNGPFAGNSPVTGKFSSQRPDTRRFDVFIDLHLKKRLSKQSTRCWFETPSPSLWRHFVVYHASQCIKHIFIIKGTWQSQIFHFIPKSYLTD